MEERGKQGYFHPFRNPYKNPFHSPPFGKVDESLHHELRNVPVTFTPKVPGNTNALREKLWVHEGSTKYKVILDVVGNL